MSREEVALNIAEALGETEERPRTQITSVVGVLGEQSALELLAETQRVEEGGGMLVPDGSRRRTPGGVFFVLARRRMTPADRVAIFGQPQGPRPQAANRPAPPKPAGNGGPLPPAPLPMRRRAVEVVTLTAGPRPRAASGEELESARALAPVPAHMRQDVSRAVDRGAVRRQISVLIRALAPADQRLVLFDVLGELEPVATTRLELRPGAVAIAPGPAAVPVEPEVAHEEARRVVSDSAPPSPPRRRIVTPLVPPPMRAPSLDDEAREEGATLRETVLSAIRSRPGVGLGDLAVRAYGEDNPINRKRVQTIVSNLKRDGKVKTSARGRFEPA